MVTYLCTEDNEDNEETKPGPVNTAGSLERNLVKSVAVVDPGLAEADVDERDGGPDEESADSTEVNDVLVGRCATGGVVHH